MKNFHFSFFMMLTRVATGQNLFLEGGIGAGNILDERHAQGKMEIHLGALRTFRFGDLGLEFATGGNLIPGSNNRTVSGFEMLAANDSRFTSIHLLYRYFPIRNFYVEPRLGYTSLYMRVEALTRRRIESPNFSFGIGVGMMIDRINLAVRYQYLGWTPTFSGPATVGVVEAFQERKSLIMLRVSYRMAFEELFW